jgi:hypothetical protein
LVARFVRDEEAVGSNPATPTNKYGTFKPRTEPVERKYSSKLQQFAVLDTRDFPLGTEGQFPCAIRHLHHQSRRPGSERLAISQDFSYGRTDAVEGGLQGHRWPAQARDRCCHGECHVFVGGIKNDRLPAEEQLFGATETSAGHQIRVEHDPVVTRQLVQRASTTRRHDLAGLRWSVKAFLFDLEHSIPRYWRASPDRNRSNGSMTGHPTVGSSPRFQRHLYTGHILDRPARHHVHLLFTWNRVVGATIDGCWLPMMRRVPSTC